MGFFDFLMDVLSSTTESEVEKYARAAKQGDMNACNQIGYFYEEGQAELYRILMWHLNGMR